MAVMAVKQKEEVSRKGGQTGKDRRKNHNRAKEKDRQDIKWQSKWRGCKHGNAALLILYLIAVCAVRIYVACRTESSSRSVVACLTVQAAALIIVICPGILKLLSGLTIPTAFLQDSQSYCFVENRTDLRGKEFRKNNEGRQRRLFTYGIYWLVSFAVLWGYFWAYNPGGFSPDSIEQYEQALTGKYNDWHPVIHTLLVFTLPMKLTGRIESIVLFQIIYCASVFAYMAYTLQQYGNIKYAAGSLGFLLMNPNTGNMAVRPWKDVTFAVTALLMMVYAVRIYKTRGKWLEHGCHMLLFAAAAAVTTLVRHNAVLFTMPLVAALFFQCRRKRWVQTAVLALAFCLVVKGPVYAVLQVEEPDNRKTEMMGLPLTIIGNAVKEQPDVLDENILEFAYAVAPREKWEEFYQCGSFNSVKFRGVHTEAIEERSVKEILQMTLHCFQTAPGSSLMALLSLTDQVYAVEGGSGASISAGVMENEYGIVSKGNKRMQAVLDSYRRLVSDSICRYLFQFIGVINLVILASVLAKSDLKRLEHWKRMLICLPVFIYNFGTMLLLTGDDFRFFYYSFLICPAAVFLMFSEEPCGFQKRRKRKGIGDAYVRK